MTPAAPAVRFRVGDPLPAVLVLRDLAELLGLGHSRIWDLYRAGELARFELLPRLGNRPRFSGARVQTWLEGGGLEATAADPVMHSRYFASARRVERKRPA
jgi:predicted DNA-binding transcriptional regulator AlpA